MNIDKNIINQKGAPAVYEDILANIPSAGYIGRLFVDSNTPSSGIYRDNGTSWDIIAQPSAGGITPTLQQVTTAGSSSNVNLNLVGTQGIFIDNTNRSYKIGDFNNLNNGTNINTDDLLQSINTYSLGFIQGLSLDFNSNTYKIGNINGSGTDGFFNFDFNNFGFKEAATNQYNHFSIIDIVTFPIYKFGNFVNLSSIFFSINDSNKIIGTFDNNIADYKGIKLDYNNNTYNFGILNGNGLYIDLFSSLLGDFSLVNAALALTQNSINTQYNGVQYGLSINYGFNQFKFGDYSNLYNNPYLSIQNNSLTTFFGMDNWGLFAELLGTIRTTKFGEYNQGTKIEAVVDNSTGIGTLNLSSTNGMQTQTISMNSNTAMIDLSAAYLNFQSYETTLNSTSTMTFFNVQSNPRYNFFNIQDYPNNAAALASGLQIGDIYRQNATLHIVI